MADNIDLQILDLLQTDGRMPLKVIAERVGLATSSTHERIRALRTSGVLRGTYAEVDRRFLGVKVEALLMIELALHKRDAVDELLEELHTIPEVRSAFLVTGQYDVIVHVLVRNMRHLKDLALDNLTSRPGVERVVTSVIYESRTQNRSPIFASDTPYS